MTARFCRLEPLNVARHAEALWRANQSDETGASWTYLPYGPFENETEYRRWMEQTCTGNDPLFFAIIDLKTDAPAGVASYLRIQPPHGSIEVGHIHYSPQLQRTPAATEAMALMMARAFEMGYRRYEWKCDALNAASRAAAQRLGLTFEGVFRQATVTKGRSRDSSWYAAIDSEWPALQQAFTRWLDPANFDESGRQKERLSQLTSRALNG